jgi:hypothetical protein
VQNSRALNYTLLHVLVAALQVYGNSTRPRTYTILEVVGCTPGGSLADNDALQATLQVRQGGGGEHSREQHSLVQHTTFW